jgi:hypothetical protein
VQQQPNDQDVRRELIAQLFAADRGRRADDATMGAYLLALKRMDTPRLARVVEKLLGGFERGDAEAYRVPQPGTLWRISREIRLGAVPVHREPEPTANDGRVMDAWDTAANLLLLNYFGEIMRDKRRDAAGNLLRPMSRYSPDSPFNPKTRQVDVGALAKARTAVFVKWKDLWARDMREDRELGGKLDGRKVWADCMSRAESELNALIASERRAA